MKTKVVSLLARSLFVVAALASGEANAQAIEVTSAGVGIGTASPGAALDVIRPGNANVYENGIRANRPDAQGQYAFMGYGQSSAAAYFGSVYTGASGVYGSIHLRQYTLGMTARDALNIDSSGNVGIGTTGPSAKLEVIGGANAFGLIVEGDGSNANARIALRRGNSTSATGNVDWIGNDNSVGARIGVNDNVAGSMAFKLGGSAQSDTRLLISSAGDVGIGTVSPSYKLHVNGSVRGTSFISDTTTYADFVFKPGYKLAPLSEVEAAILKNGHLPDIPSEAEAKANGVDLGAMQVKLLQKVEELTLHLIAHEKELRRLTEENVTLQRRLLGSRATAAR